MTTVILHITAYRTRRPAAHPVTHFSVGHAQMDRDCHTIAMQAKLPPPGNHPTQNELTKPSPCILCAMVHSALADILPIAHKRWLWMALTLPLEGTERELHCKKGKPYGKKFPSVRKGACFLIARCLPFKGSERDSVL